MSLNSTVTVTEAMKLLGTRNRQLVMNLITDEKVKAEKKGWVWLLDKESVLKHKKSKGKK